MKNVIYTLILTLLVSSCQKDDSCGDTFRWAWQKDVLQQTGLSIKYSLLAGDYFVVVYTVNQTAGTYATLHAYDKTSGQFAWSADPGTRDSYFLRDADVSGDYIILTYDDRMVCMEVSTRKTIWENIFPPACLPATQAEAIGDYVYFSRSKHVGMDPTNKVDSSFLLRTHLATGQEETVYAEKNLSQTIGYVTFLNPVIYREGSRELAICIRYREFEESNYPTRDLVAIDVNTHEQVWIALGVGARYGLDPLAPALLDGHVILGEGSRITRFTASTGTIKWSKQLPLIPRSYDIGRSNPFVYEGKIYLVDQGGFGFCLDPETGEEIWNTSRNSKPEGPSYMPGLRPVIHDGVLFVTSGALRNLVAYDSKNGDVLHVCHEARFNDTNVLYDEETNRLFVAGDDKLLAFTVKN